MQEMKWCIIFNRIFEWCTCSSQNANIGQGPNRFFPSISNFLFKSWLYKTGHNARTKYDSDVKFRAENKKLKNHDVAIFVVTLYLIV